MCNAWNHPLDCTCGWGGEGHLGSHGNPSPIHDTFAKPIGWNRWGFSYIRYVDYTEPNAICPACGELVFFISLHNGGRVFFDELGPPWPKHPCTDNSKTISAPSTSINPQKTNSFKWQREGWLPLVASSVIRHNQELLIVDGLINDKPVTFYIHNPTVKYTKPKVIPLKESLTLAKWITASKLEISALPNNQRELRLFASTISFEGRDLPIYV